MHRVSLAIELVKKLAVVGGVYLVAV